jgi:hypothetical protein
MRAIAIIPLMTAFLLAGAVSAGAASRAACDQDACVANCIKRGGQLRFCPKYCQDKIKGIAACR